MKRIYAFLLVLLTVATACTTSPREEEVRNVIFLIGDGMGLAQFSMLEVENNYAPTAFSRTEHVSLVTTRSLNNRVTDSAAAGTALATGSKTNNSMLGMLPDSTILTSMMERARDHGKATGLVVSCYLQHATPAAFYANVRHRGMSELITDHLVASNFDVMIGGGSKWLTEAHRAQLDAAGYRYVQTLDEAEQTQSGKLLAMIADEYLPQATERGDLIPRATRKALELLAQDEDGFLLMVEGSQIDGAGHANDARFLLAEMRDFEAVVQAAFDFADEHAGTLVVVTADHETGGLSMPSGKSDFTLSESGIEYRFGTNSHTAIRVPAYFYGTGADRFPALMDNTELSARIAALLGVND